MLTTDQYFKDSIENFGYTPTDDEVSRAQTLLDRVNLLLFAAQMDRTLTSGHRTREKTLQLRQEGYAAALGGAHETSEGVDIDDPMGDLDNWLKDDILAFHNLYREHPASTRGWCHLQTRAPGSGNRTFYP